MRVQDVMTNRVHTVSPDIAAEDAWNRMRMRGTASAIVQRVSGGRRSTCLLSSLDVAF